VSVKHALSTYDRFRDALQKIAAGAPNPQSIAADVLLRKSIPKKIQKTCLACDQSVESGHRYCSQKCKRLAMKGLCDGMPDRVAQAARRQRALTLRKQGMTYREIGKSIGVGTAMATILVRKGQHDLEILAAIKDGREPQNWWPTRADWIRYRGIGNHGHSTRT
jgi:hypothetical protein